MDTTITSSSVVKHKHFAKFHEKIQTKYEEMQKRLEKSKSVDALLTLKDDEDFKVSEKKIKTKSVDSYNESDQNSDFEIIVFETFKNCNEVFAKDIMLEDTVVVADTEDSKETDKNQNGEDTFKLSETFSTASLESLNGNITSDEPMYDNKGANKVSRRRRVASRIVEFWQKEKPLKKIQIKEKSKKESMDKGEKLVLSSTPSQIKTEINFKSATLTIALIEATNLEELLEGKQRNLFCRFRIGSEKYKSKVVKSSAFTVKWQELINLSVYDDLLLEINIYDKDLVIGRTTINLKEKEKEKTHQMKIKIDDVTYGSNAEILILLTMSGTNLSNTVLDNMDGNNDALESLELHRKDYNWYSFRDDYKDVGNMKVRVHGARGLSGQDSYCILELINERLQTHTEYKTHNPNWMKTFTFTVTDITSILEVTVYDEKKSESLGKVKIPLLRINNGEKTWLALKDNNLREKAKGVNARILLEINVSWNLLKSTVRVINPKEEKLLGADEKLDRHTFARNISRAKAVISWIKFAVHVTKSIFEWESTSTNAIALCFWVIFCHYFKIWMLPLIFLTPFVWYRPDNFFIINWLRDRLKNYYSSFDENYEKVEREEKNKSLRQKITNIQELVLTVQNYIGSFASLGERIKNLMNFTEPYLSYIGIFLILTIGLVMFLIPTKYIFIGWGVHKFTRKILRPDRIPNNEILDLLSRVPDDETLIDCENLPLDNVDDKRESKLLKVNE